MRTTDYNAMTTYYKLLRPDGTAPISKVPWHLPTDGQPGAWMPAIHGRLVQCQRGYHAVPLASLAQRLFVDARVYEVEVADDGDTLTSHDEIVVRRARLVRLVGVATRRALTLWACDCAERVLPIYEQRYPDDGRPRAAIEAARRYMDGQATIEDAAAAAYAATYAAYAEAAAATEQQWQQQRLLVRLAEEVPA